ncbi:hypothetical protein LL06_00665 [Hoeflea sp. BAL378]|uniref:hypothetical protein n=1 Tax=Hoeflea sp. BAL378 TaxID=1547437 RepID=UPI00051417D3|nr:hypothetical protein [Hoeflea sp. BAL378]KGF71147.1 hypothetical protein LL06_00665 [Hoeflea sp. BAL378]
MSALLATPLVKGALRILGFTIPIPVIILLGALAWVQFDKSSSIRQAVNERVKEMVAGAEIAALETQLDAQAWIAARSTEAAREADRRRVVEATARINLAARLAAIQTENEILNDDLADLLSRPVAGDCAVDADVLGRLRSK